MRGQAITFMTLIILLFSGKIKRGEQSLSTTIATKSRMVMNFDNDGWGLLDYKEGKCMEKWQ